MKADSGVFLCALTSSYLWTQDTFSLCLRCWRPFCQGATRHCLCHQVPRVAKWHRRVNSVLYKPRHVCQEVTWTALTWEFNLVYTEKSAPRALLIQSLEASWTVQHSPEILVVNLAKRFEIITNCVQWKTEQTLRSSHDRGDPESRAAHTHNNFLEIISDFIT